MIDQPADQKQEIEIEEDIHIHVDYAKNKKIYKVITPEKLESMETRIAALEGMVRELVQAYEMTTEYEVLDRSDLLTRAKALLS